MQFVRGLAVARPDENGAAREAAGTWGGILVVAGAGVNNDLSGLGWMRKMHNLRVSPRFQWLPKPGLGL